MALEILLKIKTNVDLSRLTKISRLAEKISAFKVSGTKPIIGEYFFMKESGVSIHSAEKARQAGLYHGAAFAPELVGKKGFDYVLGKESGIVSISVFLDRLGLKASKDEMREMLEIVKEESNLVKGTISEAEFEFIANKILRKG